MNTEEITLLGDTLANGQTGQFKKSIQRDGTIEHLTIHCYDGQAYDLRYTVRVYRSEEESSEPLVNHLGSNKYIAGNSDLYEFDIDMEISKGDEIRIEVENVGTNGNEYTTNLRMQIEYGDN